MPARAGAFQDRAARAGLRDGRPCLVLSGMGGVGKTQLAAEYAHEVRAAGGVDLLVWISAGSRSAVVAGYAEAAAEVCGADPGEPELAAARLLAWLQSERRRWLVVLDDVSDPADLNGLWPPAVPHGRTVVTTRRRDAALTGASRHRIDVGVFTPGEATAYLRSALEAHGRAEPPGELVGLAEDLGHLPLALSQATAYLVDAGISVRGYRDLLAGRARTLAEVTPDVLPDDQTHTMAAAWSLSVEYANRLRPAGLARPMLQLAAFLDPHGIPVEALTSEAARAYLAVCREEPDLAGEPPETVHGEDARTAAPHGGYTLPGHPGREPVAPDEAAGALRALHRLSLVHSPGPGEGGGHPAVRVHQIVQRATRDALPAGSYATAARTAGDALLTVWPEVEPDPAYAQTLRACASALEEYAEHTGCLYTPRVHPVLFRAAFSLNEAGSVAAGVSLLRRLLGPAVAALGPHHRDTLAIRHDLAHGQGQLGDAAGAAGTYAELLPDVARAWGPDDPHTFATRLNLAYWQGTAGDAVGALRACVRLLADMVRAVGPHHPDTLSVRASIAHWLGVTGDSAGATAAWSELLQARLHVLGPDHPQTLMARGNFAVWRGRTGNPVRAAGELAALADDMARVLGAEHPHTFVTRAGLAHWQGESGDPAGAAECLAALLPDMARTLGPDSPDTLAARGHLAHWRGQAGEPAAAAASYAELVADATRVLGPDHPDTHSIRVHHAEWQGLAGDPAAAADAYIDLLADMTLTLGPDHPSTHAVARNLAHWWAQAEPRAPS